MADGSRTLYFQSSTAPSLLPLPVDLPSAEGCTLTPGAPMGVMGGDRFTDRCWTGVVGFAVSHAADAPARFTASAPFGEPVVVGGRSSFTLWLADPGAPVWIGAAASRVSYGLQAVDAAGTATPVASGELERLVDDASEVDVAPTRAEYVDIAPTPVAAGSILRLELRFAGAYADAGVTVGTGRYTG